MTMRVTRSAFEREAARRAVARSVVSRPKSSASRSVSRSIRRTLSSIDPSSVWKVSVSKRGTKASSGCSRSRRMKNAASAKRARITCSFPR